MVFEVLAAAVLSVHLLWVLWVIFGALFTRRNRALAWFHIASLIYGIVIEIGPFPCPLTLLEQDLQRRAGMTPYEQPFLVHYLERIVYPDIPVSVLIMCAVSVCVFNLAVYVFRFRRGPAGISNPRTAGSG